jgi:uncharacterized membrane protein
MGLTATDILCLAVLFMVSQRILYVFGLEVLALLIALIAAASLSVIRMKYRRKIIRNAISYYLREFFLSGVVHVSSLDR